MRDELRVRVRILGYKTELSVRISAKRIRISDVPNEKRGKAPNERDKKGGSKETREKKTTTKKLAGDAFVPTLNIINRNVLNIKRRGKNRVVHNRIILCGNDSECFEIRESDTKKRRKKNQHGSSSSRSQR